MLIGKPRAILMDRQHYRTIKKLAKDNHLKLYEALHEIVDEHLARMERLKKLQEIQK